MKINGPEDTRYFMKVGGTKIRIPILSRSRFSTFLFSKRPISQYGNYQYLHCFTLNNDA